MNRESVRERRPSSRGEIAVPDGPGGAWGNKPIVFALVEDTSLSMSTLHNAVVDSINLVIESLKTSQEFGDIFLQRWSINYGLVTDLVWIDKVAYLRKDDYRSDADNTPLFNSICDVVDELHATEDALQDEGFSDYHFIVLIFTDGEDNVEQRTAADVRRKAQPLKDRGILTMAAVPIGDPGSSDGRASLQLQKEAFRDMGIPDAFVVEASDASSLRHAFGFLTRKSIAAAAGKGLPGDDMPSEY